MTLFLIIHLLTEATVAVCWLIFASFIVAHKVLLSFVLLSGNLTYYAVFLCCLHLCRTNVW